MREPNFSSPAQNKAAIVILSTLYDRRALDCTATLPLVNSLTHLAYMTSTSPRFREILASDGGLERLVKILATCHNTDKHSLWKWSLAFQCVVNIGVRGTEAIRTRVVQVGAVHVVVAILENFLKALEQAKLEKEQQQQQQQQQQQPLQHHVVSSSNNNTALTLPTVPLPPQSRSTPVTPSRRLFSIYPPFTTTESETTGTNLTLSNNNNNNLPSFSPPSHSSSSSNKIYGETSPPTFSIPRRRTFLSLHPRKTTATATATNSPKAKNPSTSSIPLLSSLTSEAVLHREEDILLSLQLLAYLSKYPHLRQTFHNDHRHNVFSVVEKFTHRIHPQTIIYWAGVIMRNACRKDELQGGIRQCAYMHCGKWEKYPREFAKCRRCRKAKYCSKTCQSRAWGEGHRWWCVERTHSSTTTHPPNATTTAADPIMNEETTPHIHLDEPTTQQQQTQQQSDPVGLGLEPQEPQDQEQQQQQQQQGTLDQQQLLPNHQSLLFYHRRRRNSRSAQSLTSGSSTEVEVDTTLPPNQQDLMEID
ncbi:hypothetical protein BC941DRAFT_476122 [Chlamydoabsidia padenii]|nr:hypothetical protein BC941DRAFT_476122 [Chlamydoabsidia padenii]